jgi:hypothetical protein
MLAGMGVFYFHVCSNGLPCGWLAAGDPSGGLLNRLAFITNSGCLEGQLADSAGFALDLQALSQSLSVIDRPSSPHS